MWEDDTAPEYNLAYHSSIGYLSEGECCECEFDVEYGKSLRYIYEWLWGTLLEEDPIGDARLRRDITRDADVRIYADFSYTDRLPERLELYVFRNDGMPLDEEEADHICAYLRVGFSSQQTRDCFTLLNCDEHEVRSSDAEEAWPDELDAAGE